MRAQGILANCIVPPERSRRDTATFLEFLCEYRPHFYAISHSVPTTTLTIGTIVELQAPQCTVARSADLTGH